MFQFGVQIRSLAGVGAFACLFIAGCGGSVPKSTELKDLATVTGQVKFKNEPTPGAFVTFHPLDKPGTPPIASAIVESDGKFAVKSTVGRELKPGAAPGTYRLSVSWLIPAPTPTDNEATKEKLPAKYQKPETSGIEVTIKPGANQLDEILLNP